MAETVKGGSGALGRIVAWALAPALLLLVPLMAMQFTDEVVWDGTDFAVAGAVFMGAGLVYALATTGTRNGLLRGGVGLAVLGTVLLFWIWAID